jgi:hypothetical protein
MWWKILPPHTDFTERSIHHKFTTLSPYYNVVVEVSGFGTMCSCRSMPTFWRNMLPPSLGGWSDKFSALALQPLKIETVCFSEKSASNCKYKWHQNPIPLQRHVNNHRDSLKSHLPDNNISLIDNSVSCCGSLLVMYFLPSIHTTIK